MRALTSRRVKLNWFIDWTYLDMLAGGFRYTFSFSHETIWNPNSMSFGRWCSALWYGDKYEFHVKNRWVFHAMPFLLAIICLNWLAKPPTSSSCNDGPRPHQEDTMSSPAWLYCNVYYIIYIYTYYVMYIYIYIYTSLCIYNVYLHIYIYMYILCKYVHIYIYIYIYIAYMDM